MSNPRISLSHLASTLRHLERHVKRRRLKGYEVMTTVAYIVTRAGPLSKSIPPNSLVVRERHACTHSQGGKMTLLKEWRLPGEAKERNGRGGASIYADSRPVDITNGVPRGLER